MFIVVYSYAVVYPRTMVVHSKNASFAYTAVMDSRRFEAFTLRTELVYLLF